MISVNVCVLKIHNYPVLKCSSCTPTYCNDSPSSSHNVIIAGQKKHAPDLQYITERYFTSKLGRHYSSNFSTLGIK